MAKIPGTNVASTIAPFTTDDQFPTHDAIYGKGGQREVATIAERDAIPLARLTEGCTCYVAATEKTYRWKSNAWVDDTPEIASDASDIDYTPSGSSTPTNVAAALDGKASTSALTEGLAGKQGTISDLDAIRSGAGKGATSLQGVKMEGDDEPLSPDGNGVVTIPQPEIPDAVTSVIANNELVFQTPDGQSVKGKVGIALGADGLLHLTLTDEEENTYSSPIAGLRVDGNELQYSNDGEHWVAVQTFGKLAIKYVQASDPTSGDVGDLALVGSTNAYVLKVYVGGSWVSVCDFNSLNLTSDGITMAGESKTLTEKMAEIDGVLPHDVSLAWEQGGLAAATGENTTPNARLRSGFLSVKNGDALRVNPNGHYVAVYLYKTDKTSALGAYAVTLVNTAYTYVCPQDGYVKFVESKVSDTSQNIVVTEQCSIIRIVPSSEFAVKDEVKAELDKKASYDPLSDVIDLAALPIQVGYPSTVGNWLTATVSGKYRYHKVIERTEGMSVVGVYAGETSARFAFMTDYSVPTRNSNTALEPATPTPTAFCESPAVIHEVSANTTVWANIPDTCKYIILIVQNGATSYAPSAVRMVQDKTDYNTSGMRIVDGTAFVQGNIKSDDGQNDTRTNNARRRTNAYYEVSAGTDILFDFQGQKIVVWKYDAQQNYLGNSGYWFKRMFHVESDGFVRFTAATADANSDISSVSAIIYLPNVDTDDGDTDDDGDWRDEYDSRLQTVARPPRKGNLLKSKMLTLLTFSDIHLSRKDELERILSFNDKYSAYIDDILSLGDIQDSGFESDIAVFRELADAGAKNILQVIGNHDYYVNPSSNNWAFNTDANVYARFFTPFISNWGVVNPTDALYWYKDYGDDGTYTPETNYSPVPRKIRLICLNTNNNGGSTDKFDSTQQTWLTNVLADAKTNGYSVVVASHYKPHLNYTNCNFSDMELQLDGSTENFVNASAVTIIQNFIDGGGKFICWLCGHEHKDYVGVTSATDTSQLVIGVACASAAANRAIYGVMDRIDGTKSQDLFNIIGFDTYNKHIRILRVGADFDCFMRSKKSLCINYDTKAIVGES